MGKKGNPIIFRVSARKNWRSNWCIKNKKEYAATLLSDIAIRNYIRKKFRTGVGEVFIERSNNKVIVGIEASNVGILIGKKGSGVEGIKKDISKLVQNSEVFINIIEVRKPQINAQICADTVTDALEKRVSFRNAMKKVMKDAMRQGAEGIKVSCSGRLGGAEIARTEWYQEGKVPLHTLRADIGYATSIARTTYGVIGVKVWIHKGTVEQ